MKIPTTLRRFLSFLESDRGSGSILELIFATGLGSLLIATTVPWWIQQQHRQMMDQTTSQEIRQVATALSGYMQTYASNIESVATATKPAVIPVSALVSTGFLPTGTNSVNPYGQTIVGEVLQPTPGYLVGAVVTQGGTAPAGSHLNQLATLIGAQGGFVPTSDMSALPGICGTNCFQGAGGGWQATFAQYPFTGVSQGSLIALQSYNANNLPQDFLYRSQVPGQPQANTMDTNVNMNGNNLNNAGTVQTYNLASPNGFVNMNGQTLGAGTIETTSALPINLTGNHGVCVTISQPPGEGQTTFGSYPINTCLPMGQMVWPFGYDSGASFEWTGIMVNGQAEVLQNQGYNNNCGGCDWFYTGFIILAPVYNYW
ncbi:shufflon system plasmid conjugative transfer pilus tip adhesin PilV [Leptospirillum ferriphilum]|uniref:shufflon system plasmid conjugative transfer pilus tip adhesin PilV n=1 Tax=Leptospirillum ferriphilum TaxID=178606 RepID=UPI0006B1A134|nr:shufflon system plasmid conjugative transfer pilus tip adhesin PilV [Leptospirillum ferriphilum]